MNGIILAGGKASRIGKNKMLLIYNKKPLIYHVVMNMLRVCDFVTIVTGYYQVDYSTYFEKDINLRIVHNPNHLEGMFSSVQKGVEGINGPCLIIPGDYPLVKNSTYQRIIEETGSIRVPVFNNRRGHPIYMDESIIKDLKNEPKESNLKIFRNKYLVNYFNVQDKGILLDIDHISDYQELISKERNDSVED